MKLSTGSFDWVRARRGVSHGEAAFFSFSASPFGEQPRSWNSPVAAMTTNQIGEYSSAEPGFGERKYGLGFGLLLAPNPNGGEPVLERYYWGGVSSTNFWVVPRRDLILLLMMQVYPTNHGGADRVFHRIVNEAIEN